MSTKGNAQRLVAEEPGFPQPKFTCTAHGETHRNPSTFMKHGLAHIKCLQGEVKCRNQRGVPPLKLTPTTDLIYYYGIAKCDDAWGKIHPLLDESAKHYKTCGIATARTKRASADYRPLPPVSPRVSAQRGIGELCRRCYSCKFLSAQINSLRSSRSFRAQRF